MRADVATPAEGIGSPILATGESASAGASESEPRAAACVDARRLARIRWRCRRGMLENDLILTRFLDARGTRLDETEAAALDQLLELTDNDLWDVLSGRAECADPATGRVVVAIRGA